MRFRMGSTIIVAISFFWSFYTAQGAQVDAIWSGGVSTWSTAGDWTPAVVPNNGAGGNTYNVKIDNGNAAVSAVTLNMSATIDNLFLDAGETLSIANGQQLLFAGGAGTGTINNAGTIQIGSAGSHTYIRPAGQITLTGGGVLQLSNHANNWVYREGPNGALVNVNNTIRGAGNLGWNGAPMPITNQGAIVADVATPLHVDAAGGVTNSGVMRAEAGGTLRLLNGTYANTGGLIEALNASTVELTHNPTIAGGTLSTTGTGQFSVVGVNSFLDGSVNPIATSGQVRITNNARLNLRGSIQNSGTISIGATAQDTYLQLADGPVTLTGGGVIQLSDHPSNWIFRGNAAGTLVNVNNTIQGAGNLGWNGSPTPITNQATVIANATNPLNVDASGGFTNTGTMRATSGGILDLRNGVFNNVGGVIEAQNASIVRLNGNATIAGGNLGASGTGFFSVTGANSYLDGTTNTVTCSASVRINNGARLRLRGTIHNAGTIELNSSGSDSYIHLDDGTVTLTGGGVVQLSDNSNNWVYRGFGAGSLVNVNNTIQGAGNIGWNGSSTAINNQGTIVATGTNLLRVDAAGGITNSGSLRATGSGGMQITSGAFTTSGNVIVDATRTLSRTGDYTQTAGTTTANGSLSVTGPVSIQGGTLAGNGVVAGGLVTNAGTVAPGDTIGSLNLNNGLILTAAGTLAIEIGGLTPVTQHDRLAVTGSTQLGGVFKVTFVNGFDPAIGNSFVVMTYPNTPLATLGNFASLDVPCNLPGKRVEVEVTTTQIIVHVIVASAVDVNCDCGYSMQDVQALILALLDPTAYDAQYPGCTGADVNNDGQRNGKDVPAFVNALLN